VHSNGEPYTDAIDHYTSDAMTAHESPSAVQAYPDLYFRRTKSVSLILPGVTRGQGGVKQMVVRCVQADEYGL
jgi:hypothetical protein